MAHNKDYTDYINSEAWFKKRDEAFAFHGKSCKKCGRTNTLHVHHKTYSNFKNENIESDLIPLCRGCHKRVHKFCKKNGLHLFIGTDEFLKKVPQPKKLRKLLKKRRRFERENNYKYKWVPRSKDIPVEEQKKRTHERGATLTRKKTKMAIDIQKMMEMYGIDEATARSVL